jgi:hypothetical protein
LEEFFKFCVHLERGKDGRKLKDIRKLSTLESDWKNFLRYYEGATKNPLDARLSRRMNKVHSFFHII